MTNLATRTLKVITYDGNRFKRAWLMASGCYLYTHSHDGAALSDDPRDVIRFSRWYCFKHAALLFWESLWRK
jgi:hypothetical protein